jgi:hypothetical protein
MHILPDTTPSWSISWDSTNKTWLLSWLGYYWDVKVIYFAGWCLSHQSSDQREKSHVDWLGQHDVNKLKVFGWQTWTWIQPTVLLIMAEIHYGKFFSFGLTLLPPKDMLWILMAWESEHGVWLGICMATKTTTDTDNVICRACCNWFESSGEPSTAPAISNW